MPSFSYVRWYGDVAYDFQVLVVGEKILRLQMFQGFM